MKEETHFVWPMAREKENANNTGLTKTATTFILG
jgi:hypothetical protein